MITSKKRLICTAVLYFAASAVACGGDDEGGSSEDDAGDAQAGSGGSSGGSGGGASGGSGGGGTGGTATGGAGGASTGGAGGAATGGSGGAPTDGGPDGEIEGGGLDSGPDASGPDASDPDATAPDASGPDGGGDGGTVEGGGDATPDGAGDGSTDPSLVQGTWINSFHTVTEDIDLPEDVTGLVQALVPTGGGAFETVDAVGNPDGSFTLDVPENAGPYWVTLGVGLMPDPVYIETSARTLDLGNDSLGRPDWEFTTTTPTDLVFDMTGMQAWDDASDSVFLYAMEVTSIAGFAGASGVFPPPSAGAPADTDTTLTGTTVDWSLFGTGLIDASQGDTLWAFQQRMTPAGSEFYTDTIAAFSTNTLTQTDGVTSNVAGAFTAPPRIDVDLDFRRTQFAALASDIHPNAEFNATPGLGGGVVIAALPKLAQIGTIGPTMDLFVYNTDSADDATTDLDFGTVSIANPFPAGWDLMGAVSWFNRVPYQLPGTVSPTRVRVVTGTGDTQSAFASGPLQPTLSPPQSIQVGGLDAVTDRTGVGLRPTLSWTAPAIGTPGAYYIKVWSLGINGSNATMRTQVALVITENTSVTLPPGILQAAGNYVFEINAVREADLDLTVSPFRSKVPNAISPGLTGILSP